MTGWQLPSILTVPAPIPPQVLLRNLRKSSSRAMRRMRRHRLLGGERRVEGRHSARGTSVLIKGWLKTREAKAWRKASLGRSAGQRAPTTCCLEESQDSFESGLVAVLVFDIESVECFPLCAVSAAHFPTFLVDSIRRGVDLHCKAPRKVV